MSRWTVVGATTGWRSTTALVVTVLLCLVWVSWPLWGSGSAPGPDAVAREFPALLAAFGVLTATVAVTAWLDADRRLGSFAAVVPLVAIGVACRLWLSPGSNGIEPVFWVPMLAGMAMGAPAGWVTGAAIVALGATATGSIGTAVLGQFITVAGWGAVGGLLVHLPERVARWLGAALAVPLGVVTGLVLNLPGWSTDPDAIPPSIAGLDWWPQTVALWEYSVSTSLVWDLMRGLSNGLFVLVAGWWLLAAMRSGHWPGPRRDALAPPPTPSLSPRAVARRARSARLTTVWTTPEGDPDDT